MPLSTPSQAESSTTRTRARLTKEGSAFLSSTSLPSASLPLCSSTSSDYARTINSYPQKTEKLDILASLRAIPGNDAFTFEKLSSWFARNRKLSRARLSRYPAPLTHLMTGDPQVDDETIRESTPAHISTRSPQSPFHKSFPSLPKRTCNNSGCYTGNELTPQQASSHFGRAVSTPTRQK